MCQYANDARLNPSSAIFKARQIYTISKTKAYICPILIFAIKKRSHPKAAASLSLIG